MSDYYKALHLPTGKYVRWLNSDSDKRTIFVVPGLLEMEECIKLFCSVGVILEDGTEKLTPVYEEFEIVWIGGPNDK